jgi:predicted CXXCH cytochrome family protein
MFRARIWSLLVGLVVARDAMTVEPKAIAAPALVPAPAPEKTAPGDLSAASCALAAAVRDRTATTACTVCHQSAKGGPPDTFTMPSGGTSHAIDVEYERVRVERPDDFRRVAELPPVIQLVGGRIACTTCHDARSPHESWTVLSGTQLCLACHLF